MSQVQTAQKDTIKDPSSDACSLRAGMSGSEVLSVVLVDVDVGSKSGHSGPHLSSPPACPAHPLLRLLYIAPLCLLSIYDEDRNLAMHPSRARQIADALEDDYVHDDLVALSGDEDAGDLVPDDDESGDVSGGSSPEEGKTQEVDAAASAKKRKRREKEKERKAKARPGARSSMRY
jgi:hypothetical protein